MAFLDPDRIQESVLKQYDATQLEGFPSAASSYLKARTELLQTSLVTKNRTEANLTVHRIVQDATRSSMSLEHYQEVFRAVLHLLFLAWPFEAFDWRHSVARWRKCEELFPHVLSLKRYAARLIGTADNHASKVEYCKLLNDAGWYYHETGHFTESQDLIEHAQQVAKSLRSNMAQATSDPPAVAADTLELDAILAETHHNLGCIGTESNQPEFTLLHFTKFNEMMIAAIDEQTQATDNRLAISWNELGNAHMMNN
ncbi:hypothetical protein NX059_002164 [Plenodomus lindquistii]|nr:hypothetical protein NX059_002164 [Plenodomus lindquistii]